jgi:hypothetical protein
MEIKPMIPKAIMVSTKVKPWRFIVF